MYKIRDGMLPTKTLSAVDCFPIDDIPIDGPDNSEYEEFGIEVLRDNVEIRGCIKAGKIVMETTQNNTIKRYEKELLMLISAGYFVEMKVDVEVFSPFVTELDSIVYGSIVYCYHVLDFCSGIFDDDDIDGYFCVAVALAKLFNLIQENEKKYGFTLNVNKIIKEEDILSMIVGNWECIPNKYIVKLSSIEKEKISSIQEKKKENRSLCKEKRIQAKKFISEEKHKNEWSEFISLLNNRITEENQALAAIQMDQIQEKTDTFERYISYVLDKSSDPSVQNLGEAIEKRLNIAPFYCLLKYEDGTMIDINGDLWLNALLPTTMNFLIILYHYFRVQPNQRNAINFFKMVLFHVNNNLRVSQNNNEEQMTIDEVITACYNTIMSFVDKHRETIEALKYKTVSRDNILSISDNNQAFWEMGEQRIRSAFIDYLHSSLADKDSWIKNRMLIDRLLAKKKMNHKRIHKVQKEKGFFPDPDSIYEQTESERIVKTVNIIYLFVKAINIAIDNELVADDRRIGKLLSKIQREESNIIYKVYDQINENCIGIDEYRRENLIDSSGIETKEKRRLGIEKDQLKQTNDGILILFDSFLRGIKCLLKDAESGNVDQIIEKNTEMHTELRRLKEQCKVIPDQLIAKFEENISYVSELLIKQCKKDKNEFDCIKEQLKETIGKRIEKLPPEVIDTLSTAELLFSRYANTFYIQNHFDYSCISALYYQAFEGVFNKLLWTDYANKLNQLTIDNKSFSELLEKKTPAGYLPENYNNRKNYIYKQNDLLLVKKNLTMGNMGYLLLEIQEKEGQKQIQHFCCFMASHFGYIENPFDDNSFNLAIKDLQIKISNSVERRNNASHGEMPISYEVCEEDKSIVLAGIQETRNTALGLIQQFLNLYKE